MELPHQTAMLLRVPPTGPPCMFSLGQMCSGGARVDMKAESILLLTIDTLLCLR